VHCELFKDLSDIFYWNIIPHLFDMESHPRLSIFNFSFNVLVIITLHNEIFIELTVFTLGELERWKPHLWILVCKYPFLHVFTNNEVHEAVICEKLYITIGNRCHHEAIFIKILQWNVLFDIELRIYAEIIIWHDLRHIKLLLEIKKSSH